MILSSISSFFPKVLKRRHRKHIKHSDVDSTPPHSVSGPGGDKLEVVLPAQPRVDDISMTSSTRDSETLDLRYVLPTGRFSPSPSQDDSKDPWTRGADTSSPFEQPFQWPLSSVERSAEVLTTSSRTSSVRGIEGLVFDCSTVPLAAAILLDDETSTLISLSTNSKPLPDLHLTSALDPPLDQPLRSTTEGEPGTLVGPVTLDPVANHTALGSFEYLASIPPLHPSSSSPPITEILLLFDPLYTGSSSLDPLKTPPPVRQSLNPFTLPSDRAEDGVLVNLEQENVMINYSNSNPFRDSDAKAALFSGSSTTEPCAASISSGSPPRLTITPENCSSSTKLSSLDTPLAAVETLEIVDAQSVAKSVSFVPPLKLIGGTLSKWAQDSIKKYKTDDVSYRKKIKGHRIVEWRRYRVKKRDPVSGNRHEYIVVKIEHVKSKETHFIRFERWRRDKHIKFDGKSGRTIDWSPDLDRVTILEDWVVADGDTDALVERRVFNEDHHQLDLLDLFLVASLILQIPGNCVELGRRSSHWFAVIFSNVLDQDVARIKRKYSHKRGKLDLPGWFRESSREERDCALKFIFGFRGELDKERAKYGPER